MSGQLPLTVVFPLFKVSVTPEDVMFSENLTLIVADLFVP